MPESRWFSHESCQDCGHKFHSYWVSQERCASDCDLQLQPNDFAGVCTDHRVMVL